MFETSREKVELGDISLQLPIFKTQLRSAPAPSKFQNLTSAPLQLRGAGSWLRRWELGEPEFRTLLCKALLCNAPNARSSKALCRHQRNHVSRKASFNLVRKAFRFLKKKINLLSNRLIKKCCKPWCKRWRVVLRALRCACWRLVCRQYYVRALKCKFLKLYFLSFINF